MSTHSSGPPIKRLKQTCLSFTADLKECPAAEITNQCRITDINQFDVGRVLNSETIVNDRELTLSLLRQTWMPSASYAFPYVAQGKRTRARQFSVDWFKSRPWLAYTRAQGEGALCKYCVLFGRTVLAPQGGFLATGAFCTRPFTRYKDATESMNNHQITQVHQLSEELARNYESTSLNPETTVVNRLLAERKRQVLENRERLRAPIETIIFLCRQNLPLRGRVDWGKLDPNYVEHNEGNFREALRFRILSGDTTLKKHLESAASNATYISPTIQNEIINTCDKIITRNIRSDVGTHYFSVLADETTDVAGVKQLSLTVRYVRLISDTWKVCEEFLGFTPVHNATGEGLAKSIVDYLVAKGYELANMRGQGYDGCAAMSGKLNGVQTIIRRQFPTALYFHCANHRLNLALVHSSEEPLIRNTLTCVNSCSVFLTGSSNRKDIFDNILTDMKDKKLIECGQKTIQKLCPTRWVDSHRALITFKQLYTVTLATLDKIVTDSDRQTSSQALSILDSITSPGFIVALVVTEAVAALMLPLSKKLQTPSMDMYTARKDISETMEVLMNWRSTAETEFSALFLQSLELCKAAGVAMSLPRRTSRQTMRPNYDTDSPEIFYRLSIYIPYIDHLLTELETRFENIDGPCAEIQKLIPINLPQFADAVDSKKIHDFYSSDLDTTSVVRAEVCRWCCRWLNVETKNKPDTAVSALDIARSNNFPNIGVLLELFASLPVTTASAERSFSTLRRLKTYLRSTMETERLSGMAVMAIHRDRAGMIKVDDVIDELATKPRRLDFVLA
jgi:Domain of unknown function (DUF4371)/hAT family C-terminal dimerisation region